MECIVRLSWYGHCCILLQNNDTRRTCVCFPFFPLIITPSLMPAHMALFLAVLYMFSCQWIVASYLKLLRPFSTALLRSVTIPRYWAWCMIFAFGLYYGWSFYLNYWMKVLAVFTFGYYLTKVSAFECIKIYQERVYENE